MVNNAQDVLVDGFQSVALPLHVLQESVAIGLLLRLLTLHLGHIPITILNSSHIASDREHLSLLPVHHLAALLLAAPHCTAASLGLLEPSPPFASHLQNGA